MYKMSEIIDVHHHIVPKAYIKSLSDNGIKKTIGVNFPGWDVKKTLKIMDHYCISTSILSISAPGVYFKNKDLELAKELSRQTNEICRILIDENPERFGAFATLPLPDVEASIEELKYAYNDLKLDGIILLSNYDGYYLGDPRFDELFSELNRLNAVVFIHPASSPGIEQSHLGFPEAMMDVCFETTRTVFSLIINGATRKYPNIQFILAHAGGTVPYTAARLDTLSTLFESLGGVGLYMAEGAGLVSSIIPKLKEEFPDDLNLFLKFKENMPKGPDVYLKNFYYDTALSASPHAFASLQTLVDSSQIVFGSDYIFATEAAVPLTIKGITEYKGFSENDVVSIEKNNVKTLFPRLNKD